MSSALKQSTITKTKLEEIAIIMADASPPTRQWWANNYSFLDGAHFPDISIDPIVDCFNLDTMYKDHWRLIQLTFHFILGYKLSKYASRERSDEYMQMMKELLIKVRTICDQAPQDDYAMVLAELQWDFELLVHFAHNNLGSKLTWAQDFLKKCCSTSKNLCICIFKKLNVKRRSDRRHLKDDLEDDEVARLT